MISFMNLLSVEKEKINKKVHKFVPHFLISLPVPSDEKQELNQINYTCQ